MGNEKHDYRDLISFSINNLKRGYIYKGFLYLTILSTIIIIITVFLPLSNKFKAFIIRILHWKFNLYGMLLNIYDCILISLKFFAFLFICKLVFYLSSKITD